jgi:uncharacterized protein (DUF697 family)/tellurite resistance protein
MTQPTSPAYTPTETQAILTVALLAAFADGAKHEREGAEITRIAQGLAQAEGVHLPTLVDAVKAGRVTLAQAVPALASEDARHLAYEMATGVCNADGSQTAPEQAFLAELRAALKLEVLSADAFSRQADELAMAPLAAGEAGSDAAAGVTAAAVDEKALDAEILSAAITNGALELLPESLSTLAIIPLQMKLVYRIGRAHGYELDSGHVKDFLATAGVGLTSQYLEQAGRKLLGGLLGRLGGGLIGGLGRQAVSSGMSFVSTYALGQLAKRYYSGGRVLSTEMLKDTYTRMAQEAQALYRGHLPAIQEKARSLDVSKVLATVRSR